MGIFPPSPTEFYAFLNGPRGFKLQWTSGRDKHRSPCEWASFFLSFRSFLLLSGCGRGSERGERMVRVINGRLVVEPKTPTSKRSLSLSIYPLPFFCNPSPLLLLLPSFPYQWKRMYAAHLTAGGISHTASGGVARGTLKN